MTDQAQALRALIEKVEAGSHPQEVHDAARDVFDETSAIANARIAYCGSLDAAKALHDALLPNFEAQINQWPGRKWCVTLGSTHLGKDGGRWVGKDDWTVYGRHEILARAWLISILKVKLAEAEQ